MDLSITIIVRNMDTINLPEGVCVRMGRKIWKKYIPEHLVTTELRKLIEEATEAAMIRDIEAEKAAEEVE